MTVVVWTTVAVFALLALAGWTSVVILAGTVVKLARRIIFWRELVRRWESLYGEREERAETAGPAWEHEPIDAVDPRMN